MFALGAFNCDLLKEGSSVLKLLGVVMEYIWPYSDN